MKKLFLVLLLPLLFTSCGFEIVDDGYVGVKRSMGKIDKDEYKPGIHFYNPITTSIFEMEIREKSWTGKVSAYSADNQIIEADFKVNYRPVSSQMAELYTNQGEDYINVILPQRVTAPTKEVLGKYKATDLVSVRNKVNSEVKSLITKRLEGTNIILVDFEITNFDYDNDFEAAVKAKIVAKERAIEEQNRTVQIKEQATQKVLQAEAEATKIKVMAAALAKNKDLIQLEAVKKWDGKLPQYMLGNGTTPFINLKK
jgi:prohibitin 2